MTPSRARRLAGWASIAALAGYWLSVMVEDELERLERERDSLLDAVSSLENDLIEARLSSLSAEDDA